MGIWKSLKEVWRHQPSQCAICGKTTRDILTTDGQQNTQIFLCREHLVQRFEQAFKRYSYYSIVCYPNTERYYSSLYPFYPLAEFKKWNFRNKDAKTVSELIQTISLKRCSACDDRARHLYFGRTIYKYSGPDIVNLKNYGGVYLCTEHTLEKILDPIKNNPHDFDEWGVFLPYGGEGIFVSTPL